ncbi:MAG: hypothetical protein HeimC2_10180 [Candidatus Heimdallarchaeota archaeon LC_2]|nr:MAG: hypothetical protein HeimC2_10180 [Candidatus Heimdallarchaeota archaeon LC_2]
MHNGIAFTPDPAENIISLGMMASDTEQIIEGTIVEIFILIKNFSNDTLNNVTITQTIQSSLTFIQSPYKMFNGTAMEYNETVSIENQITKTNISLNYFNIYENNFTMNLDRIDNLEEIRLRYTVNVTEAGTSIIQKTSLEYYDKYGDKQPLVTAPSDLILQSIATLECEKCDYFESVDLAEINWGLIFGIAFVIILAGLLSRSLYKKKPFE